jgi:uncharacterized protein (DUF2267 family)
MARQRYRWSGAAPDTDVGDDVLADRVRSSLGPLEKRRDLPHVHVTVRNRIAVLHGELPTADDVSEIQRAVLRVPGVHSLESHLHVGLSSGTTRPSAGDAAHRPPSAALRSLLEAATAAGVSEPHARTAVRAVLGAFTDRLPSPTRDQLLAHLPEDARAMVGPPSPAGTEVLHARTVAELGARVAERGLASEHAVTVMESVLARVRELVPEEVADVAAVLPPDLRELWVHAVPA